MHGDYIPKTVFIPVKICKEGAMLARKKGRRL